MRLQNKVVLIAEADSPSGKALLVRLAAEGASFVLNSASGGLELTAELEQARRMGAQTLVVNAALWRSGDVARLLEESSRSVGPVDVLIHNCNRVLPIGVEDGEEERFLEVMNANAKSAFVSAKAVGRQMAETGRAGRIVFVNSIHAEKPTGSSFAYSASKGAVKMLAREASVVLGRQGIGVYSIELGPMEGDDAKFRSELSDLYESYRYKVPGGELGTYGELAELVLFLCGDGARYLNGADIRMDGGFLLHYLDFKMKLPPETGGDRP
ncbi:SDR family NAD(P)-dependent oxidoreductase [Cohnella caldifontis]|uniref:SDR family NAD(P)-dependent oxidoreductase n=1 Tax=Cohnella caldifontis TaxID=3027471 RepID=UPI0023ECB423|nr:SDR family oxidoreductase [Cohnella sp. YIM B05605]